MTDLEQLKQELEEIRRELKQQAENSRAYRHLKQDEESIAAQIALQGTGAIAQGEGSTAINQNAVGVRGDVSESLINTGTIFQIYQSAPGKAHLNQQGFEHILRNYLEWVRKAYGKARLYGLESIQTSGSQKKRDLSEVFVPLALQKFAPPSRAEIEEQARKFKDDAFAEQRAFLALVEQKREGGEALPAESLLASGNRIAVIGGAGSGKSTLLAYLAAMLAEHELSGVALPFQIPSNKKTLIPLIIPLRYRREYLRLCKETPSSVLERVRPGTIAGFVLWYLKKRSQAIRVSDESLAEEFFDRLLLGGGCLVMLDGLDEVVSKTERGQVRAEVERLADELYPDNVFIVTARESGYKDSAIFSEDFTRLDVQSLEDEQIEALARNWCEQLYPDKVEEQLKDILDSIHAINSRYEEQGIPPLICTPLMTTMVVSVKWGETELPRERARLYESVVKVILQAQYLDDDDQTRELVNWGGAWEEQREWLSYLALEMHRSGQNGAAIPESRLRDILAPKLNAERLEQFIRAVRSRGGLFEERAELFQFAHLTFQEFLSARLLTKDREKSFPIMERHITDAWWHEVLLLVYGFSKQDYPPFAAEYLKWLSTRDQDRHVHLAGLELAGAAVLELAQPNEELRRDLSHQILTALMDPELNAPALLRFRAGNKLTFFGDPRFDPDTWMLPKEELLGFVPIPAGKFLMGSDPAQDAQAYDNEQPQHEVTLPDFWVARYPVTRAQYHACALDLRRAGEIDEERFQEMLAVTRAPDSHPVVRVTYHDATAYCLWLNRKMKELSSSRAAKSRNKRFWKGISEGQLKVALPTEAEWEKAARGTDGRIYSWGNEFDEHKINSRENEILHHFVVGTYPLGASPYGVMDMCGNVWEWTRSILGIYEHGSIKTMFRYPYEKDDGREDLDKAEFSLVLRGGSYHHVAWNVRCAIRDRYFPEDRYSDLGFRVVISSSR